MQINMCPSSPLKFVLANFIYTIDDLHNIHLVTHLYIEDSFHAKIHGLIDWDPLVDQSSNIKHSQEHTLVFPTHDSLLDKIDSHEYNLIDFGNENWKTSRKINIVDYVNYLKASPPICIYNDVMKCLKIGSKKPSIENHPDLILNHHLAIYAMHFWVKGADYYLF